MGKSKLNEGQQDQSRKLRKEGLSYQAIAKKMEELYQIKISFHSIRNICIKAGIDRPSNRVPAKDLKNGPGPVRFVPKKKKDPAFGDIGAVLSEIKDLIDDVQVLFASQLHGIRGQLIEVKGKLLKATK